MELYVIDNKTLDIISVCNVCDYNLNLDEETNGISEFVLPNLNYIKKGCYLVLNGLYKQFLFVVDEDIAINKNETCVTVPALDISNIFDRKVILKDKEKMQEKGIENFIADTILENFANANDTILNLDYIDVYIHSNTKSSVAIDEDNGLYNFHTFLINCRQYKDIYTEFSIINKRLKIDIGYKLEETMLIDATLPEVTNYNKIYEVDPVTKVEAYIRADSSTYCLYLTADRATTTDKDNPDRIFGRIETISCDTLENAKEEALNTIKANTYKHLVEFSIAKTSKLIDVSKLYLGRRIKIKTEDSIYDSYISAITITDENFVSFKTGNLRIDFTDKQRQQKRDGTVGNKIDKSGGTVTGNLKIEGTIQSKNTDVIYIGNTEMWNEHTTTDTGFHTVIECYGQALFDGIFAGIKIPNGYKKRYRISAYITTTGSSVAGVAINKKIVIQKSTWSGGTFRSLTFSDFFDLEEILQEKLTNYDGSGYNAQMYYSGGGTGSVFHATLHGYLIREE